MTPSAAGDATCWTSIGVWGRGEPKCPELDRVVHCRNCEVFSAAARALLDREAPSGYGREWSTSTAAALAEQQAAEPTLVFRIGSELFALGVPWVAQVAERRAVRSLPHVRDEVLLGIVNVEGDLRPCVSLEVLFGQARPDVGASRPHGRLLVIGRERSEWAVPVDEALAIHRLPGGALEQVPATVARSSHPFLTGMFPWRGQRVGLLDADLVLGAIARRLA
jgi:chemotaxis-related protein WspD